MQYRLNIFTHTLPPEAAVATAAFLNLTGGVIASLFPQSHPMSFSQTVDAYEDHIYTICADNHNPANHLAWCLVKLAEHGAVEIIDNSGHPLPHSPQPQVLQFSWGEQPTIPSQHNCMEQYGQMLAEPLRVFHSLTLHQLTISCRAYAYTKPHLAPPEGVTEAVVARYALELAEHDLIRLKFGHKEDKVDFRENANQSDLSNL